MLANRQPDLILKNSAALMPIICKKLDDAALYDLIAPHIAPSACCKRRVIALLPLFKERAKTHLDIVPQLGYLVHDGAPDMTEEARALLSDDAKSNLLKLAANLTDTSWKKDDLNSHIQRFLEDNGLKMRDIGLPLRAAITGTKQSPSIVDIMSVLGEGRDVSETSSSLQINEFAVNHKDQANCSICTTAGELFFKPYPTRFADGRQSSS